MRMRTSTFQIPIKQWFPPEDPIAILIVKLCILREDYLLELAGLSHGKELFPEFAPGNKKTLEAILDENSVGWRRVYFYRNALRTLFEIRTEIESFYKDSKLKAALAREPKRFRDTLKQLRGEMRTAEKTVERIRHTLGGHVSRGGIKKTLRDMSDDMRGFLQAGQIRGKIRYKFVAEIVLRMMLPDVQEHELLDKLDELLKKTSQLIPVFGTIDDVISLYVGDRKLTS
jgi:hypothetical protein